jgi:hypothetical protein
MKKVLIVVSILVIVLGGYYVFRIERNKSRIVPDGAVSLEFPLKDGSYQAVQSGRNGDIHTLAVEKYALDITKPTKLTDFFKFRQSSLESNSTFGTPIFSPCAGNVTIEEDGFPDMPIGIASTPDKTNHVTVDCGQFYVAMVHLKKDSALVKVGDIVSIGQQIGSIGNSGHTTGPHLHIMAYRIGSTPDDRIALPIIFNGKYLFRGDIYP